MIVWKSFGVSMIGPGHVKNGLPNQDAFSEKHCNSFDCIVASDGVGSCPRSDIGSRKVCSAVLEALGDMIAGGHDFDIDSFTNQIKSNYLRGIKPFRPRECSATCLCAVQINGRLVLGMLGDGVVACVKNDGCVVTLSDNKEGSFSNLVSSLSERTKVSSWKFVELGASQCRAILLCTDGISDDLNDVDGFVWEFAKSCSGRAIETNVRNTREMLAKWPVPRHSDDKTIVCMYPVEVDDEK